MIDLTTKIRTMLEQAVAEQKIAGANVLVIRRGEEVVYTQAGFADVENRKPYERSTIVRMFSMSKPVTGAAAMKLVEDGCLDLAQPVGDLLPAFRDVKVLENGTMTTPRRALLVRDLLSMTSGLPYPGEDPVGRQVGRVMEELYERSEGNAPLTTRQVAEKLAQCGLCFHPGEKWMYGTSADVLGAVIEAASGMRFGEFLKQNFFAPLGMAETAFYVPAEKRDRLASTYSLTDSGLKFYQPHDLGILDNYTSDPPFESGGAGLYSTIDDYARFAQMLLQRGTFEGKRILSPKTVEFFTHGRLYGCEMDENWKSSMGGFDYGNLMRNLVEPGQAIYCGWKGEYGWDGWLGTYFCNSPENDVTVLLTMQRKDGGMTELTRRIRNVLFANLD